MANVDRPNGFRPIKSLFGGPWVALLRKYPTADRSADTTNNHGDLYIGDPVKLVSGQILPANSGDTIAGVVVGLAPGGTVEHGETGPYNPSSLETRYLALTETTGFAWIVPAEGVLFEVQTAADLDLVYGGTADINLVANTAHGSRTTGLSNVELVTPVNNDVEVVEHNTSPDNDVTLVNARHIVKFVTTEFAL